MILYVGSLQQPHWTSKQLMFSGWWILIWFQIASTCTVPISDHLYLGKTLHTILILMYIYIIYIYRYIYICIIIIHFFEREREREWNWNYLDHAKTRTHTLFSSLIKRQTRTANHSITEVHSLHFPESAATIANSKTSLYMVLPNFPCRSFPLRRFQVLKGLKESSEETISKYLGFPMILLLGAWAFSGSCGNGRWEKTWIQTGIKQMMLALVL